MLKGVADRSHRWHKHHIKQMIRRANKISTALSFKQQINEHKFRDLVANITSWQRFKWKMQKKFRGMLNYGRAN